MTLYICNLNSTNAGLRFYPNVQGFAPSPQSSAIVNVGFSLPGPENIDNTTPGRTPAIDVLL